MAARGRDRLGWDQATAVPAGEEQMIELHPTNLCPSLTHPDGLIVDPPTTPLDRTPAGTSFLALT
jgi:hypothetical protein